MKFELRSGDGNMGTTHDQFVNARDMEDAVQKAAELYSLQPDTLYGGFTHVETGVSITDDGDDMVSYLTASFGPNDEVAYNGGAWWYAEVIAME